MLYRISVQLKIENLKSFAKSQVDLNDLHRIYVPNLSAQRTGDLATRSLPIVLQIQSAVNQIFGWREKALGCVPGTESTRHQKATVLRTGSTVRLAALYQLLYDVKSFQMHASVGRSHFPAGCFQHPAQDLFAPTNFLTVQPCRPAVRACCICVAGRCRSILCVCLPWERPETRGTH